MFGLPTNYPNNSLTALKSKNEMAEIKEPSTGSSDEKTEQVKSQNFALFSIEDVMCSKHRDQPLTLYCYTCATLICDVCFVNDSN